MAGALGKGGDTLVGAFGCGEPCGEKADKVCIDRAEIAGPETLQGRLRLTAADLVDDQDELRAGDCCATEASTAATMAIASPASPDISVANVARSRSVASVCALPNARR